MSDKTLYFNLCNELDEIMIKSGIRELCKKCHLTRLQFGCKKLPTPKDFTPIGGCCPSGCRHLTSKGCNSKSLCCKLWLCWQNKQIFIDKLKKINKLKRYHEILNIAVEKKFIACSADWEEIKNFRKTEHYSTEIKHDYDEKYMFMKGPKCKNKYGYEEESWKLKILPEE